MKKLTLFIALFIIAIGLVQAQESAEITGTIAYIGADYNVYTVDQTQTLQLTDDASDTRHYQFPTWSTDGRLAYFCCDSTISPRITTEVYVTADGSSQSEAIYRGRNEALTYAYWSPANCDGENCREIAVLLGGDPNGFKVELVRDSDEGSSSQTLGTGSPFYFSWSPDGEQMLWQRNNQRVDVYSVVDQEIIRNLDFTPGLFPAPMWSPVDNRLLLGRLNPSEFTTDLITFDDEEIVTLAADLVGQVAFNWSPDGEAVAFRTLDREGYSSLRVVDGVTGEGLAESEVQNVVAFFWSPDGKKIAFVIPERRAQTFDASYSALQQEEIQLVWHVLDVAAGTTERYVSFAPTGEMLYLLSYFDQFTQSHRVWSPDSTQLVFSEVLQDGDPFVSILDTEDVNAVPFSLSEGVLGIWSYQ